MRRAAARAPPGAARRPGHGGPGRRVRGERGPGRRLRDGEDGPDLRLPLLLLVHGGSGRRRRRRARQAAPAAVAAPGGGNDGSGDVAAVASLGRGDDGSGDVAAFAVSSKQSTRQSAVCRESYAVWPLPGATPGKPLA
ncbi:hypothetical protein EJB05_38513, partial [Eragrostis curvula]